MNNLRFKRIKVSEARVMMTVWEKVVVRFSLSLSLNPKTTPPRLTESGRLLCLCLYPLSV